jgi:hypothetical protein
MNEIYTAFVVHESRRGAQVHRATRHTHNARVFRLIRPGAIGTLAVLPGDPRMGVIWRSNR